MLAEVELPGFPAPMQIAGQPIKFAGTPADVDAPRAPTSARTRSAVLRAHGASDAESQRSDRAPAPFDKETP